MRRVRVDLEREHARILRQPRTSYSISKRYAQKARPGDIAVDNTDPVFLTLSSKAQRTPDEGQPAPFPQCATGSGRSANSFAMWVPRV